MGIPLAYEFIAATTLWEFQAKLLMTSIKSGNFNSSSVN